MTREPAVPDSLIMPRGSQEGRPPGPIFWSLGFRPFFLLAGTLVFAGQAVWAWAWAVRKLPPFPGGAVGWHAHEMLFGFGGALIGGFVLTAARNWTGRPTAHGRPLVALVLLWLAARYAVWSGPVLLAAVLELAFWLGVAIAVGRAIFGSRNRRNYPMPFLLSGMGVFAATSLIVAPLPGARLAWPMAAALALVMTLIAWIGGRVIPFFTRRFFGGTVEVPPGRLELTTPFWVGVTVFLTLGIPGAAVPAAVTGVVAVLLTIRRAIGWFDRRIWGVPLLWVLHTGWWWFPLFLALLALSPWWPDGSGAAIHAGTTGVLGVIAFGMMARVSRGHTGRALAVGPWTTVLFLLLQAAALIRVIGTLLCPPAWLAGAHALAAGLWALAGLLFVVIHTSMLTGPRADGRPDLGG